MITYTYYTCILADVSIMNVMFPSGCTKCCARFGYREMFSCGAEAFYPSTLSHVTFIITGTSEMLWKHGVIFVKTKHILYWLSQNFGFLFFDRLTCRTFDINVTSTVVVDMFVITVALLSSYLGYTALLTRIWLSFIT